MRVVEDAEPYQSPTLSEGELAWAEPALAEQAVVRWLMTSGLGDELPALEDFIRRPEWHQRAACRGLGHEAFVVGTGGRFSRRELSVGCSVRQDCLETALANDELVGLWGGTTEVQRRQMRRGVA